MKHRDYDCRCPMCWDPVDPFARSVERIDDPALDAMVVKRLAERAGVLWAEHSVDGVADLTTAVIADARAWLGHNSEPLRDVLDINESALAALVASDTALAAMVYAAQIHWRVLEDLQ